MGRRRGAGPHTGATRQGRRLAAFLGEWPPGLAMSLIRYVTRVHFADRVLEDALASELARARIRRPLVVLDRDGTDPALVDRLEAALAQPAGMVPVERADCDAWRLVRRRRQETEADGLVGFGGAASLALAKAGALPAPQDGADGLPPDRGGAMPVLAIPVSLEGAGSLGDAAVLNGEGSLPLTLRGPALVPKAVLCDPTLLIGRSGVAMAAAGMDALARCLEAFLASAFNPPADGMALEGLRRVGAALERAVDDPVDLEARRDLLAAALNGALAEQKGLGGSEALARGVEAEVGTRHGTVHGILLPEVLSFNAPAVGLRYRSAADALGLDGRELAAGIADLATRIGLPRRLGEAGVPASALPAAARRAEADPANRTNPRLARAEDYRRMLEAAL